ncbi:hypothetical protein Nepgr_024689 [Nepenthes gracilis]|uniref:Rotamase n=1 Tax=Nepenthes gracilis TaxID=150966 RepID=A0AAD3Y0R9_NEPGR|nr:hypothetical protein Nepgr_024689 [Nepenthes gracilis]
MKILKGTKGYDCPNDGAVVKVKLIGKLQDGTVFVRKGHGDRDKLFELKAEEEQVIEGLDKAHVLNLIDLVVSKSSKTETTGSGTKEGSYINKSLLMLSAIPEYLGDAPSHHCHSAGKDDKLDDFRDNSLLREPENEKESPPLLLLMPPVIGDKLDLLTNGMINSLLSAEQCQNQIKLVNSLLEVENEKPKLQHVQLLEENSGLREQNQKLSEEAPYANVLASAAAVEIKNLVGKVIKLSLQNAKIENKLQTARDLAQSERI